jgi:hypothetical protein
MANVKAVHFVGESIVRFLDNSYPDTLRHDFPCTFKQSATGFLANSDEADTTLSLLLHRIQSNEYLRQSRPAPFSNRRPPLALDLDYLLTVWSKQPGDEHVILTWAMRQLQLHAILDGSALRGDASWKTTDKIEIVPAELTLEQMARIWDKMHSSYRLSVAYTARVVLVEEDEMPDSLPVVAEQFSYGGMPGNGGTP